MTASNALTVVIIAWTVALSIHECQAETKKVTFTYKTVRDLEIKADMYRPDDQQPRPVVVWLHGGALINGHRVSVPKWLADACRERDYVLVSLDYRLAPETQLPRSFATSKTDLPG